MIWAAGQDKAAAAADALFNAYWVDGRDIGDRAVLGALADEIGLDAAIVGELLESGADREAVLALHDAALDLGVTGVPVMTFNRKVMRLGADSSKSYSEALDLACA
jgi:predicted DsbA family dithiol-disulfide isomerase